MRLRIILCTALCFMLMCACLCRLAASSPRMTTMMMVYGRSRCPCPRVLYAYAQPHCSCVPASDAVHSVSNWMLRLQKRKKRATKKVGKLQQGMKTRARTRTRKVRDPNNLFCHGPSPKHHRSPPVRNCVSAGAHDAYECSRPCNLSIHQVVKA